MATLADKQTELATIRAAINAVYLGQAYTQGDRSLTRADLGELTKRETQLAREVTELQAVANGARNPLVVTAAWR